VDLRLRHSLGRTYLSRLHDYSHSRWLDHRHRTVRSHERWGDPGWP